MSLNYKHLHYFWVVAREGSMTRAADRLNVAIQTISGQISLLEKALGRALFKSQGRGLALTEAGEVALGYAEQIFQLGDHLVDAVAQSGEQQSLRLRAGISDGIPKLFAYQRLSAVLEMPQAVQLVCHEGEFDSLLGDLALHRLDVVLTDRPAPSGGNLKLFSTLLGDLATAWYAVPALHATHASGFPGSLAGAPALLPTRHH